MTMTITGLIVSTIVTTTTTSVVRNILKAVVDMERHMASQSTRAMAVVIPPVTMTTLGEAGLDTHPVTQGVAMTLTAPRD